MRLVFLTSNAEKYEAAREIFSNHGLRIERSAIDFVEPQKDDVKDIVLAKLRQAANVMPGVTVVVEDTAIGFESLGGFPGPYVKYAQSTIGNSGFLRLMAGEGNRRVVVDSVCGALRPAGSIEPILSRTVRFNFHLRPVAGPSSEDGGWSEIWHVFESEPTVLERTSLAKMAARIAGMTDNNA